MTKEFLAIAAAGFVIVALGLGVLTMGGTDDGRATFSEPVARMTFFGNSDDKRRQRKRARQRRQRRSSQRYYDPHKRRWVEPKSEFNLGDEVGGRFFGIGLAALLMAVSGLIGKFIMGD